ncbi:MAG: ABC transporter permease subunit, partial [Nitrososphaerales archaeon]
MRSRRRLLEDRLTTVAAIGCVCVAVIPLLSILFDVVSRGIGAMSVDLFTHLPAPPGYPGGGISNGIIGTLVLVALGSVIGIPVGVLSGVYISEFSSRRYGPTIRFLGDVLAGVPSIVTGILVYSLVVLEFHYSALAGSLALGIITIPITSNATTEALRAVPDSIREGSLALGIRSWRTSLLVLSNARGSVATGALLSISRIAGET